MPDLDSRTEHEDEAALLILLYLRHIDFDLRDGVAPDWQDWSFRLSSDLTPILAAAFLASATQLKDQFGLGVSVPLEQQAMEWASRQAQEVANGVANRTRLSIAEAEAKLAAEARAAAVEELEAAQQAIREAATAEARAAAQAEWEAAQQALQSTTEIVQAQLPEELEAVLGEARAEAISVTEITNGITQGEAAAASEVEGQMGIALNCYWNAELDGRTCPVCKSLHGRPKEEWQMEYGSGPPAHPSCRCTLDWRQEV